jgi:hypothetical protein
MGDDQVRKQANGRWEESGPKWKRERGIVWE